MKGQPTLLSHEGWSSLKIAVPCAWLPEIALKLEVSHLSKYHKFTQNAKWALNPVSPPIYTKGANHSAFYNPSDNAITSF